MPDWITRAAAKIIDEHHKHNGIWSHEIAAIIHAEFARYRDRVLVARDDGRAEQGDDGA